jgi:predicted hotdog family 3-hydroxylacyl-ACP dehydratase
MAAAPEPATTEAMQPCAIGPDRVREILPHGEEALLIDHVPWFEPGREAIAALRPLALERMAAPRAGDGAVPPMMLIEAVAQLAGILISSITERPEGPTPAWLAGVRRFRLLAPAPVGVPLTATVRLGRRFGRLIHARGEVFAGATRCAEGTVTVAVAHPG